MSTVANKRATRTHVARRRYAIGLALAAVLALVLLLLLGGPGPTAGARDAGDGTGDAGLKDSSTSFTIEGNATEPISPGVRAPLDLTLTNPHDVPMLVTGLSVSVQEVSAPNADRVHPCAVGDFAVDQVSNGFEVTIAAGSTSTLTDLGLARAKRPHVGMLDRPVNQDGCKGATLTLAYTASGTLSQ